jgi:hypothetical protein
MMIQKWNVSVKNAGKRLKKETAAKAGRLDEKAAVCFVASCWL